MPRAHHVHSSAPPLTCQVQPPITAPPHLPAPPTTSHLASLRSAHLSTALPCPVENEMLVNRVYLVKKMVRRLRRERKFLMEELDRRGDNYRSLPLTIAIEEDEKSFALPQTSSLPALGRPRSSGSSLNARRQLQVKRERVERDSSTTPKRANNAFLQFCQEQREAAVAHHLHQTGRNPDKKQLTRQLASRWNALPDEDKKLYVERYERERDRERQSEERRQQRQQDT